MEGIPEGQPTIDIQVVDWTYFVPCIPVLIDGTPAGFLKNERVKSFPVAPGVRKVQVRFSGMRSEIEPRWNAAFTRD